MDLPPTEHDTLSLHDALPISAAFAVGQHHGHRGLHDGGATVRRAEGDAEDLAHRLEGGTFLAIDLGDRKSTRLNSSHVRISYAVFCLKKKITYQSPNSPEFRR